MAFPRRHTEAYPLSLLVAYFPSPLVALRHHVQIPYLFDDFSALCSDPLLFRWFCGIVFGSPFFRRLSGIMSESLILSAALRYRVWIPYFFDSSLTSCPDPLSFRRLSNIVSGSLIVSTALRHLVRIPYLFNGSPISCPDPLSFWRILWKFK